MSITNTTASINTWHKLARPKPTEKDFQVQLGCHFEEVAEMLECLTATTAAFDLELQSLFSLLDSVGGKLKRHQGAVSIKNPKLFIDSIADQVVTGIGTAYCAGMNAPLAIERVDISNWSKFVDGKPVFNEYGKIAKPSTYKEPDLRGCF